MIDFHKLIKQVYILIGCMTFIGCVLILMFSDIVWLTGWLAGCFINFIYSLLLSYHTKKIGDYAIAKGTTTKKIIRKTREYMLVRFLTVALLVFLCFQIPIITPLTLLIAIAVYKPCFYIQQFLAFKLSKG